MVHLPSGSLQRMRHAPIAIAWKVQHDPFDGITYRHRCFSLAEIGRSMLLVVVPGAIDLQQLAEAPDGKGLLLLARLVDYRVSLLKGSLPNAPDRISPKPLDF